MEWLLYPLLGALVAAFGTLIGAGGGIIFVPLFLLWFQWPPAMIAGTSLTIVLANALSGTIAYVRQDKVRYDAAIVFALATIPGAIGGAILANHFSGAGFRLSFGSLLAAISLLILWKNLRRTSPMIEVVNKQFHYPLGLGLAISFVIGFISSILGIGGGVLHVPAMIYLLGFPTHIATATSHFVLAISAAVGVATHAWEGHIYWRPALLFSIGAIIGAQAGAYLSKRIHARSIIILLAIALLALGLRLLLMA